MRDRTVFILIPLTDSVALWGLGGVFFLVYFGMFPTSTNWGYVARIRELPRCSQS